MNESPSEKSSILDKFFLLSLPLGFALFAWAIWENYRIVKIGWDSADWPKTPGFVQESNTCSERRGGGRYGSARNYYFPVVLYTYSVEGAPYSGTRIQVGNWHEPSSLDRAEVEGWVRDHWRTGTSVEVRYNPSNPSESVLIPGSPLRQKVNVIVGGGFALLMLVAFTPLGQIGRRSGKADRRKDAY